MRQSPETAKKRVLIIRNAYSYDFGGGERVPVELGIELLKNGHQATVVSRSPKLLEYARLRNVKVCKGWWWSRQDWGGRKILILPIFFVWQLILVVWYMSLILRFRVTSVHAQSRDDFIAATLAARLLGKQVVWSDHADLKYVYANHSVWYKNPIGKTVYFCGKLAKKVIMTSQSDKKLIEKSLGHSVPVNYTVIYNGVRASKVVPKSRPARDRQAVIFSSTSRLVIAKGIGELVEAFQIVNSKYPNTRLWLFGEGPDEEKFRKAADDNKNIVFCGFPEDSMSRVASSDIFVHPSYHEGFSVSLIEAASLGLPIIACDVGGNPELVKNNDNGLLVPVRDPVALANAMQKLVTHESLRSKYGKNARETYEKDFIFENIAKEKILPLYE